MFVSKNLIFLELQKTGGSHILRLLESVVDGKITGKHNQLNTGSLENRFVFGSIRNPWDWYVSLWAYGVSNRGAIRQRTATGLDFKYYHAELPHYMGKNWLTIKELIQACKYDFIKPINKWKSTYQESDNAEKFRAWLKMMLTHKHRFDFGEGYGFSPLSNQAGLMTYRYFRLFTLGNNIYTNGNLSTINALKKFDDENCIAKGMIRTENLEDDFINIMDMAGQRLTEQQISDVRAFKKTNTSKRNLTNFYYDQESIDLVMNKEKFLIDKYAYAPPMVGD